MDTTCISPLPLFAIRHSPKGMAAGNCPQMAFLAPCEFIGIDLEVLLPAVAL